MAWNSPRPEPDPVRRLARDLEDEQKEVADKLAHLREELHRIKNPAPAPPAETVWRAQEKTDPERSPAPNAGKPGRSERVHSAQRRRDRARFIALAVVFLIVICWLIHLL